MRIRPIRHQHGVAQRGGEVLAAPGGARALPYGLLGTGVQYNRHLRFRIGFRRNFCAGQLEVETCLKTPNIIQDQGWGGTEFTVHSSYSSALFLELELNSVPIFQKFYYKELN